VVIAALASFAALLVAWLVAPAERRAPAVTVQEPAPIEGLARAA
jgi:hypothetical protein